MSWWHPEELARRRPFLEIRARVVAAVRAFFAAHHFVEVETPALQVSPGLEPHLTAFSTELLEPGEEKRERHLHTHRGHLTFPNAIDRQVLTGDIVQRYTLTDEAAALRRRIDELAARGVTELAYQPAGPDIPRELTAFARMAGIAN